MKFLAKAKNHMWKLSLLCFRVMIHHTRSYDDHDMRKMTGNNMIFYVLLKIPFLFKICDMLGLLYCVVIWWSSYVKNDGQAYNGQREHHFTIYLGKMYHWSLKSQNYCKTIVICFLDLNKLDQAKTQGFWIQLLEYPIPPRHKNCQVPISRKPIDPLVSKQAEKILKKI